MKLGETAAQQFAAERLFLAFQDAQQFCAILESGKIMPRFFLGLAATARMTSGRRALRFSFFQFLSWSHAHIVIRCMDYIHLIYVRQRRVAGPGRLQ